MANTKLVKFIPDKEISGLIKDYLIAESDSEVTIKADPSVIAQLLLREVEVKEVSADGSSEEPLSWENLWTESEMPEPEAKVYFDNSSFVGILVDYTMPRFKVSARCTNVSPESVVNRKVTISGATMTGIKVLVNGEEKELDESGSFTHTHTGNYGKTDTLNCKILSTFPVGTTLTVTQAVTKDEEPLTGEGNTITGTIKKAEVNFNGTEFEVYDKTNVLVNIKQKSTNIEGILQTKATVTQEDGTPIEGVKFDGLLGIDGVTDEEGNAIIHELTNYTTPIPEKTMKLPLGLKGNVSLALSAQIKDVDTELTITAPEILFEVKTAKVIYTLTNKTASPIIGAPIKLGLQYRLENNEGGNITRVMRIKKGEEYITDFSVKLNDVELVSDGVAILGTAPAASFVEEVNEVYDVHVFEAGTYSAEIVSVIKGEEVYTTSGSVKFTVAQPSVELVSTVPSEPIVIGSTANLSLKAKVANFKGSINHNVTIQNENGPYVGDVILNGNKAKTNANGAVCIKLESTDGYVSQEGVTSTLDVVTGLKGDWTVKQALVSKFGKAVVCKTEEAKTFKVKLAPPAPVILSEVDFTDTKVVITKEIEEDCVIMVTPTGTQEQAGEKLVAENVTTVTGLTEDTQYDIYVQRLEGDRSTVLTIRTDKTADDLVPGTPIAPNPVLETEVAATNTVIKVTKDLRAGYKVVAFLAGETETERGSVEVQENVTTISGLTHSTAYDLYVKRPVPDEQGGGFIKSTKLTVTTKPTVTAPAAITTQEVTLTNTTAVVNKDLGDCTLLLFNAGTQEPAGTKSSEGTTTTFSELTPSTSYDLYVSRTAPDYQGGGELRSEKLTITTKATVVAPGPVLVGEVALTNTKITVTKTLEEGCSIIACNKGTDVEAGSKAADEGVTTITGLTGDTEYDLYVTRKAPEYQGGQILKSEKLTVRTKPTVVAPGPVLSNEAVSTNVKITVTKQVEEGCEIVLYNTGTETPAGSKSSSGNTTTFDGLVASTNYDLYVTRTAPDYQGGGVLKSEKLVVQTKPTVVAPQPVINSEVETTNVKVVITKDIEEDCQVVLYNLGTEQAAGSKDVQGNVATFSGLTADTQYDVFVTRNAPDYQGGGVLKSTKLTVRTKPTVVAPGPVLAEEAVSTNVKITITKELEDGCTIMVYNEGTEVEAGSKQVVENTTTVTGLTGDTNYDVFVTRTAPDYQGGGLLKSTKLVVRTKPTVVAPQPVIESEVETTNTKAVITKTVEPDCSIIVCNFGTEEEAGSKQTQEGVTTVTGLTGDTQYDVYVTRTAPEYQGSEVLKSSKLTIRTKPTVVAPGPVLIGEVQMAETQATITKTLAEGCVIVACTKDTQDEVGERSVMENVTTITGLAASTEYDLYVTLTAPEYQGGELLRSEKLRVSTTAAAEIPPTI